jgi:hypothetical protein
MRRSVMSKSSVSVKAWPRLCDVSADSTLLAQETKHAVHDAGARLAYWCTAFSVACLRNGERTQYLLRR